MVSGEGKVQFYLSLSVRYAHRSHPTFTDTAIREN